MRVVNDTNVVVSAALKNRTPEEVILFIAGQEDFEWIVLPAIVEEYNEVLYGSHIKKWMFCQYRLLKLGGF